MEANSIIVPSSASNIPYLLLGFTVAIGIVYYYLKTMRMVRLGNLIPGPNAKPIVGNAFGLVGKRPAQIVDELAKHRGYGKVVRVFVMRRLFVLLLDPRDVEIILSSYDHIDKSAEYRLFEPWLGDGLLISTGHKWRSHRKLIAPTFHLNILKTFIPIFYENSVRLVKRLRNRVGREFDCHDYMSSVTVDILVATVMGVEEKGEEGPGWEYASAVMKLCDIIHRRHYNPQLRWEVFFKLTKLAKQEKKLLKIIHSFVNRVIGAKKNKYAVERSTHVKSSSVNGEESEEGRARELGRGSEKSAVDARLDDVPYIRDDLDEIDDNDVGQKTRSAFLDAMLEISQNGANLTEKEIGDEVNTLMFEGHDTTAAGSSFVLCMLGIYRDIQTKVFQELEEIFQGSDRPATFDDTVRMKYLERVILESMRLYPPVPIIARKITRDVKLHTNDYLLPAGTTVLVSQFLIHRQEEFYPNPLKFDPDNFLPEKTQERHYYAFIPFSAGPRSCVGRKYAMLKLKILLSTILRNYEIQSDITEEDFRLQIDIILKRTDGFRIRIEPRVK